jgi:hypothetical protein
MKTNLYQISVPRFVNTLRNLENILYIAEKHAEDIGLDQTYFSYFRLYPDMMPLFKQVKLASDNCIRWVRLITDDNPTTSEEHIVLIPYIDPADSGVSIPYLRSRVRKTISFFEWLSYAEIAKIAHRNEKVVTIMHYDGSLQEWTTLDLLINHTIPNLHFHCTTTYNILRHNGVNIGKADYISTYPWEATLI